MKVSTLTNNRGKQVMETRKLQITGGSTYIISLPKKWIVRNQLKKGSALNLSEEGGALLVMPSELAKQEKSNEAFIKVLANDDPSAIIRKVVSTYLVGYNLLHMKAERNQNCHQSKETN